MDYLSLIRLKISDKVKYGFDTQFGDGHSTEFRLSHSSIQTNSVSLFSNDEELTTGFSIDYEQGIITFSTPPELDVEIETSYRYSVFTDEEINLLYSEASNNVDATILALIEILLVDSARRMDYEHAQSKIKASQVFKNLKELYSIYKDKVSEGLAVNAPSIMIRTNKRYFNSEEREGIDISRYDN